MFAITTIVFSQAPAALQLANELGLEFIPNHADPRVHCFPFVLVLTPDYLGLYETAEKKFSPFYIDFLDKTLAYRREQNNLRREYLIRAIGLPPHAQPLIIDATAGLGRDSYLLASAGYEVIMLERSPLMFALLRDAMQRAALHAECKDIIQRMQLIHADAFTWLREHALPVERKSIIYLDPMFPARQKTAAVKKEMRILQKLLGHDDEVAVLLKLAVACANYRVVVKRPRLAPEVGNLVPNFTLLGKSSRFDIYLPIGDQRR